MTRTVPRIETTPFELTEHSYIFILLNSLVELFDRAMDMRRRECGYYTIYKVLVGVHVSYRGTGHVLLSDERLMANRSPVAIPWEL